MAKRRLKKKAKIALAAILSCVSILIIALIMLLLPSDDTTADIEYGHISEVPIAEEAAIEELSFIVIDVGQAQSIFIDYADKEVLIDGGSTEEDSQKIIQTIKEYVDGKLDYVIATHSHTDHIGGLPYIYDYFDIGETIYGDASNTIWSQNFIRKAKAAGPCHEDQNTTIELGARCSLTIYDILDKQENINNNSVVCLLTHGNKTFYIAGDLEADGEILLRKTIEKVDVAVLSHHGSSTSNTNLDILRPSICLASVGANNDYGFIHEEVLTDALLYSHRVFATYKSGTMTLTSNGASIQYDMDESSRLNISDAGSKLTSK